MGGSLLAGIALITGVAASGLGCLAACGANADVYGSSLGGTLVSTSDMQVGRAAHTATGLPDGRVLVVGGFNEKGSSKGAEAYEIDTGRFAPLPSMVTTRHSHTATLLHDGKVLIVGG